MHLSTHSFVIFGILSSIHAVNIDLYPSGDSSCSSSYKYYQTCSGIRDGDYCTSQNGAEACGSIRVSDMKDGQMVRGGACTDFCT
jgi:hypothetical protein